MATMHGGSFSKTSLRPSRLILLRKAIFPSAVNPTRSNTSLPMSTPITIGDDILDSIRDFMLLLLLNVASHQRLAQLGKQPVHPISRRSLPATATGRNAPQETFTTGPKAGRMGWEMVVERA